MPVYSDDTETITSTNCSLLYILLAKFIHLAAKIHTKLYCILHNYIFKLYLIVTNSIVQLIQSTAILTKFILLIGRIKYSRIQMSFECLMQNHKNLRCSMLQFSTHIQQQVK